MTLVGRIESVIDNIAVQAVENCLLSGISELISPPFIMQMDKELVCRTAGELQQSQGLRLKTQQKLKILQAGLGVCVVYMKRKCEIALYGIRIDMRVTGWLDILGVAAAELGFAKQDENS